MKKYYQGFTLAEVLITLAVIGIVAAFTIPSLNQSTKNSEYHAAMKKAYSDLSQACQRMVSEESVTSKDFQYTDSSFSPVFKKYFKVQQDCGRDECVDVQPGFGNETNKLFSSLDGTNNYGAGCLGGEGQYIATNGFFMFIQNGSCFDGGIFISVDVNGYKHPNRAGMDIYTFQFVDTKILPLGAQGTYSEFSNNIDGYCKRSINNIYSGATCAYKVLNNIDY